MKGDKTMSATIGKALAKLYYKIVGEYPKGKSAVKIIDELAENYASAATTSKAGPVKQGAAVSDAAGSAPTAAEFKALLDSLRDAGIIAE